MSRFLNLVIVFFISGCVSKERAHYPVVDSLKVECKYLFNKSKFKSLPIKEISVDGVVYFDNGFYIRSVVDEDFERIAETINRYLYENDFFFVFIDVYNEKGGILKSKYQIKGANIIEQVGDFSYDVELFFIFNPEYYFFREGTVGCSG